MDNGFDVNKDDASNRMETRVANSAISELMSSAGGYTSLTPQSQNVKIEKGDISYVMLPVYMLNIFYNNKMNHFAMNGENGKFIGEIPMDRGKAFAYSLLVFIVTLAICLGVNLLF